MFPDERVFPEPPCSLSGARSPSGKPSLTCLRSLSGMRSATGVAFLERSATP